ncbi:hypothetical protein A8C56_18740 [Niabella ginsenosidivorans]|uniref:Uncharacterized protein n=2 Tax=Niabella ginsenosidivorans TaxID=1176587 RepID=A0A1A9I7S2_9BACT|nr:hypothetical protein A8C56_18740 [Niabella ginsenosidivorans]
MLIVSCLTACIKADSYAEPDATIRGTIYDSLTGQPLQLDMGEASIQLLELSWTATAPTPNPNFGANTEGYYNNSRIFKGYYNININGPFVPLAPTWPSVIDSSRNINIQGVTTKDFTVSSMLVIQWVTPPVFNASDSSITATIKVIRGTNHPAYNHDAIKNINFYINGNAPYPANSNYDNRYTNVKTSFPNNETVVLNGVVTSNVFAYGNNYIVKSIGKIAPTSTPRTWWVRVGACTTTNIPVVGTPLNYSTIQTVTVSK